MSEDVTEAPEGTEGQATEGSEDQTTQGAPEGTEGQASEGTTDSGPHETFFDPKTVPEELLPAYKQMQGAFTKRMQQLKEGQQKIDAYDAFSSDPVGQLQQLARQYGFQLTRAEAAQQLEQQKSGENFEPQSWDEVFNLATEKVMQQLDPVLKEVQQIKRNSIEHQLNEIDPTWMQYEKEMQKNLELHPSLAKDAALLYKMSVPDEVLQGRAVQKALSKMEAKGKAAQGSGKSTTTKSSGGELPDKPVSFNEAVKAAKKKLDEEGVAPPGK